MPNLFAFARGDQAGNPNVHTYRLIGFGQRRSFNLTYEAGVPFPGTAGDANGFDRPFEWAMPANGDATDPRQAQAPPLNRVGERAGGGVFQRMRMPYGPLAKASITPGTVRIASLHSALVSSI